MNLKDQNIIMEMLYQLKLRFIQIIAFFSIGCFTGNLVFAQSNISNKYGLNVVKDIKILQDQIKENPAKQMVSVDNLDPRPVFDLRYTTTQNLMHKKLYPTIKTTWLQKPAAKAMDKILCELSEQKLGSADEFLNIPFKDLKKLSKTNSSR